MFNKIIMNILPIIVAQATPEIKSILKELLSTLESKAKKTPNPIDDILVEVLKSLFAE